MISSQFFKKPRGDWDNVPKHIENIKKSVISEDWRLAEQETKKLDTAWETIIKRIEFSSERNEINSLTLSIARLKASITAKDKTSSLVELSTAMQHWDDLGK